MMHAWAALHLLLAATFAAGAGALVLVLGIRRPVDLSQVERLYGSGQAEWTPMQRLQRALEAARFQVTAGEFLRVSGILAVLAGLGAYLISGAPLAGLVGAVMGGASYWLILSQRVAKALESYEDELPQVISRLTAGARLGNSLTAAAEYVARFGPPLCREDWATITAQLRAGAEAEAAFRLVAQRRDSPLLNSIFELLLVQQQRQSALSEVLPLIQTSLEERVHALRKARTKMMAPIRELWIVCSAPFAGVVLLRVISPEFSRLYGTLEGQLLLLIGWGIDVLAFAIAYRAFSAALRRETSFHGALPSTPRPGLQPALDAAADRPDLPLRRRGEMPSAFSALAKSAVRAATPKVES